MSCSESDNVPRLSATDWASKHALADAEMYCPARLAAQAFHRHNVSAFHFQFRHAALEVACAASNKKCNPVAAQHASDIPFWLSNRDGKITVRSLEELQLARNMSAMVASLAASGNPGASWPAWDEHAQSVMVFDVAGNGGSSVKSRMREQLCEFWASVPDRYTPIM